LYQGVQIILAGLEDGIDFIHLTDCHSLEFRPVVIYLLPLFTAIDIIDLLNGNARSGVQADQFYTSPREVVKMFHRGSTCSCLKDLYYNLKDNTPKMLGCYGCREISDLKNIFECKCKTAIYCSRACAEKDWANHT
jgi:hypothetical protein